MTKRDDELVQAKAQVRFCELKTLAAWTAIIAAEESKYGMKLVRHPQTVADDPLLQSIREAQMALELLIETLRVARADLDNSAARLQQMRRDQTFPAVRGSSCRDA